MASTKTAGVGSATRTQPDRRRKTEHGSGLPLTDDHRTDSPAPLGAGFDQRAGRFESALSRAIDVRNGQRAMGRARGRLLQTSLIFQALLALALALSVVAFMQDRSTPVSGSPDAEPPPVLVQVSE